MFKLGVLLSSVVLGVFLLISVEAAIISNATCVPTYSWADNSKGQNPCLVAAFLQGACFNNNWEVPPLPLNTVYAPPNISQDTANECTCSTPVYELLAACSDCQNRTFQTWAKWSIDCPSTAISPEGNFPLPIPANTSVPHWALMHPSDNGDSYNATAAKIAGDKPELSSTSSSTHSSHVGAIVGGIVGGILGLAALIAIAAIFFLRRRRENRNRTSLPGHAKANSIGTSEASQRAETRLLRSDGSYHPTPTTSPGFPSATSVSNSPGPALAAFHHHNSGSYQSPSAGTSYPSTTFSPPPPPTSTTSPQPLPSHQPLHQQYNFPSNQRQNQSAVQPQPQPQLQSSIQRQSHNMMGSSNPSSISGSQRQPTLVKASYSGRPEM